MAISKAKFLIGQSIHHKLFNYRGIVVGVDLEFKNDDQWYEMMAKSRPPKDKPWYHVRVHDGRRTYVAEQNLDMDPNANN